MIRESGESIQRLWESTRRRVVTVRGQIGAAYSPSSLLFSTVLILAALAVLSGFLLAHYYDKDVFSSITYLPNDGWCTIGQSEGLGVHCFGDYASVVLSVAQGNPWLAAEGHVSNYPASGMLPQLVFGTLGAWMSAPRLGLVAYLLVLMGALIVPALWAGRGKPPTMRLLTVCLFGLLSVPSLMTLDRGNTIGFVVPALLTYLVALRRERYALVVIAIIVASLIKPQFALLVVMLLVLRKWKYALVAVAGMGITNLVAYLAWPRDFPSTVWQSALTILNYGGGVTLSDEFPPNVSLAKGYYWIELLLRNALGASTTNTWTASHASSVSAVTLAVTLGTILILGKRIPSHVSGIALVVCASLFASTSWSYYLVFALPIAAIILRDPLDTKPDRHRWNGVFDDESVSPLQKVAVVLTVLAVAATVIQVVLPVGATIPGSEPTDFARATVLHTSVDAVPALWLCAIFASLLAWSWTAVRRRPQITAKAKHGGADGVPAVALEAAGADLS